MALLLGESHLRQLLTMRDLVPLMERTLAAFSAGRVLQPVRTAIPVQEHGGFLFLMPAYLRDAGAMGLKAVALYPGNAARGLPALLATILLYDPATGKLLGVLDGRLITEMRTAAVSAAATKHLARRGAKVIAFLGAGVQARSHMEALLEVCRPAEVRVWTRTRAHADAFAREVADRHRVAGLRDRGRSGPRGRDRLHHDQQPDPRVAGAVAVSRSAHQRGRGPAAGLA